MAEVRVPNLVRVRFYIYSWFQLTQSTRYLSRRTSVKFIKSVIFLLTLTLTVFTHLAIGRTFANVQDGAALFNDAVKTNGRILSGGVCKFAVQNDHVNSVVRVGNKIARWTGWNRLSGLVQKEFKTLASGKTASGDSFTRCLPTAPFVPERPAMI